MEIAFDLPFEEECPYGKDVEEDKQRLIKIYTHSAKEKGYKITPGDIDLIKRAYDFCIDAHKGQKRKKGEPFYTHPLKVAIFLIRKLAIFDSISIASALLHDTVEDNKNITYDIIEQQFGKTIPQIIDGLTKIKGKHTRHLSKMETLIKLLNAVIKDIRIITIKLADRYDNLRTLNVMSREKQKEVAEETRAFYIHFAHMLGFNELRREMQDYAYYFEYPERFTILRNKVSERKKELEQAIKSAVKQLEELLKQKGCGTNINIFFLHKPTFEVYDKILKLQEQNPSITLDKIIDNLKIADLLTIFIDTRGEEAEEAEKLMDHINGILQRRQESFEILSATSNFPSDKVQEHNSFSSYAGYVLKARYNKEVYDIVIRTEEMAKENIYKIGLDSQQDYAFYNYCYMYKPKKVLKLFQKWLEYDSREFMKQKGEQSQLLEEYIKKVWRIIENNLSRKLITCTLIDKEAGDKLFTLVVPNGANAIDLAFAYSPKKALKLISVNVTNENFIDKSEAPSYKLQNGDKIEIIYSNDNKDLPPYTTWYDSVITFNAIACLYFAIRKKGKSEKEGSAEQTKSLTKLLYVTARNSYTPNTKDKSILEGLQQIIGKEHIKRIFISTENSTKSFLFFLKIPNLELSNEILTKISFLPEVTKCKYVKIKTEYFNNIIYEKSFA